MYLPPTVGTGGWVIIPYLLKLSPLHSLCSIYLPAKQFESSLIISFHPIQSLTLTSSGLLVRSLITGRDYNQHFERGFANYCLPGSTNVCPNSQVSSITLYYFGNTPDILSRSLSCPRFLLCPLSPSSFPSIFPPQVSSSSLLSSFLWYSSPPPIFDS